VIALWERFKTWLVVIAGLVVAGVAIWIKGRQQGKQAAKNEQAQQVIRAHEVRDEIEVENAKLPDAPPQRVADADPGTAAGKLRDDGWVQDGS
jgi:cytoskeletal protein RodZ